MLEARDRVGGRVWSQELVPGDPCRVSSGAANSCWTATRSCGRCWPGSAWSSRIRPCPITSVSPVAAPLTTHQEVARCAAAVASPPPPPRRGDRWPRWRGLGRLRRPRWPRTCPGSASRTASAPEVLAAASVAESGGFARRPSWRVAGGNQRLAERTGRPARVGGPAAQPGAVVEHGHDGVRVVTDDGEVAGDAVIVAVPMAVLRGLPFSPPLPDHRAAWRRAGLAHNAKLHVPLTAPGRRRRRCRACPSGSGPGRRPTGRAQVQPVLHAFGGTGQDWPRWRVAERAGDLGAPGGGAAARTGPGPRPGAAYDLER